MVEIYNLDDVQWAALYEMRKAIHLKYYSQFKSAMMQMDLERFRTTSLKSVETLVAREFIFFADEAETEPMGWMRFFSGNEDLGFQMDALAGEVPREMLHTIATLLLEELNTKPFRNIITGCQQERIVAASRSMGPDSESPLLIMQLLPKDMQHAKITEWAAEADKWKGILRFELMKDRPENHLDAYVELQNKLLKDMPMEGGPVEYNSWNSEGLRRLNRFNAQNNQTAYSIVAFDMEGNMVGTSDINIRRQPLKIQQAMTGLLPPYRGKGLAKVLKGLMLKQVLLDFPDFDRVVTTTSRLNLVMQHINHTLGFKIERKMYEFVFKRESLTRYLQDKTPPVNQGNRI
jgi:RimJ/RimL family protein N-acetyltransferase